MAKAIIAKANEKRLDVTPPGSPDATAVGGSPEAAAKNVDLQSRAVEPLDVKNQEVPTGPVRGKALTVTGQVSPQSTAFYCSTSGSQGAHCGIWQRVQPTVSQS